MLVKYVLNAIQIFGCLASCRQASGRLINFSSRYFGGVWPELLSRLGILANVVGSVLTNVY